MSGSILGVDIAKRKFDGVLLINGKLKHKVFTNNEEGFELLMAWLQKQNVDHVHVCLEASSTYGDELATSMHDAGHTVSIVNPARIKGFARSELLRTKNDKVDAGLIARFCHAMHPEPWAPLPPEIRTLQALVRRVDALLVMRTQELNRIETTHETVTCSIREHIAYLDQEIAKLKKQIAGHIKNDPHLRTKRDLLRSIPGIGEVTIAAILGELALFERTEEPQDLFGLLRGYLAPLVAQALPHRCPKGSSVDKLHFALALRSFAVSKDPDIGGDPGIIEKLLGDSDQRLEQVVLQDEAADFALAAAGVSGK